MQMYSIRTNVYVNYTLSNIPSIFYTQISFYPSPLLQQSNVLNLKLERY